VVNCPALATAVQAANKPWMKLAEALGSLTPSPNSAVSVQTFGSNLQRLSAHLCPGVQVGMLSSKGANLVNVAALAQAAGVKARAEHLHGEQRDGLTVTFDAGRSATGTLVEGVPSLLAFDGAHFGPKGVPLQGNLLLVEGDVAQVAQAVSAQGVRIVTLATAQGGRGCVAVHTEGKVQGSKLQAVKLLAQIIE